MGASSSLCFSWDRAPVHPMGISDAVMECSSLSQCSQLLRGENRDQVLGDIAERAYKARKLVPVTYVCHSRQYVHWLKPFEWYMVGYNRDEAMIDILCRSRAAAYTETTYTEMFRGALAAPHLDVATRVVKSRDVVITDELYAKIMEFQNHSLICAAYACFTPLQRRLTWDAAAAATSPALFSHLYRHLHVSNWDPYSVETISLGVCKWLVENTKLDFLKTWGRWSDEQWRIVLLADDNQWLCTVLKNLPLNVPPRVRGVLCQVIRDNMDELCEDLYTRMLIRGKREHLDGACHETTTTSRAERTSRTSTVVDKVNSWSHSITSNDSTRLSIAGEAPY